MDSERATAAQSMDELRTSLREAHEAFLALGAAGERELSAMKARLTKVAEVRKFREDYDY